MLKLTERRQYFLSESEMVSRQNKLPCLQPVPINAKMPFLLCLFLLQYLAAMDISICN